MALVQISEVGPKPWSVQAGVPLRHSSRTPHFLSHTLGIRTQENMVPLVSQDPEGIRVWLLIS